MKNQLYDKIIIGAGFYGLYSAAFCGAKGQKVLVLEREDAPFKRATYINQARVHQGYHYPRSLSTAMKSAGYFAKFSKDFDFCINKEFEKIYAVSSDFSWTNRDQFMNFCKAADIPCTELNPKNYFKDGLCDGAFLTREYTYDAHILRDYYLEKLKEMPSVTLMFDAQITAIEHDSENYTVELKDKSSFAAPFVLNATYASVNQVSELAGFDDFKIKYELCEIILCDANEELKKYGFTMMDGPFFSIMPFGKTGYHSLTSVTFTPHSTSYDATPTFTCQKYAGGGGEKLLFRKK
ncbi:MAG: FAD-dependent oxidoreductase [Spirochaetales bacterium]|nr:FAD-dependent oxidoreductase [Spirochaetales bacterium]